MSTTPSPSPSTIDTQTQSPTKQQFQEQSSPKSTAGTSTTAFSSLFSPPSQRPSVASPGALFRAVFGLEQDNEGTKAVASMSLGQGEPVQPSGDMIRQVQVISQSPLSSSSSSLPHERLSAPLDGAYRLPSLSTTFKDQTKSGIPSRPTSPTGRQGSKDRIIFGTVVSPKSNSLSGDTTQVDNTETTREMEKRRIVNLASQMLPTTSTSSSSSSSSSYSSSTTSSSPPSQPITIIPVAFETLSIHSLYIPGSLEMFLAGYDVNELLREAKAAGLPVRKGATKQTNIFFLSRHIRNAAATGAKPPVWAKAVDDEGQGNNIHSTVPADLYKSFFSKSDLRHGRFPERISTESSWQTVIWTRESQTKAAAFLRVLDMSSPDPFPPPLYIQVDMQGLLAGPSSPVGLGDTVPTGRLCLVRSSNTRFKRFQHAVVCGPEGDYPSTKGGRNGTTHGIPVATIIFSKLSDVYHRINPHIAKWVTTAPSQSLGGPQLQPTLEDETLLVASSGDVADPTLLGVYETDVLDIQPLGYRDSPGGRLSRLSPAGDKTPNFTGLMFDEIVDRLDYLLLEPRPLPYRIYIAASLLIHPAFPTLLITQPHNASVLERHNIPTTFRLFIEPYFLMAQSDESYLSLLLMCLDLFSKPEWVPSHWVCVAAVAMRHFILDETTWSEK